MGKEEMQVHEIMTISVCVSVSTCERIDWATVRINWVVELQARTIALSAPSMKTKKFFSIQFLSVPFASVLYIKTCIKDTMFTFFCKNIRHRCHHIVSGPGSLAQTPACLLALLALGLCYQLRSGCIENAIHYIGSHTDRFFDTQEISLFIH